MNMPESDITFVPKQALTPTPQLYDELVADGMEKLAEATLTQIPSIENGAVIHDNGCETGAATAAVIAAISDSSIQISIKATDINDQALEIHNKQAADQSWPAEAIHMDSTALSFPDGTFTHSIGNAFSFVLPHYGIDAVRETYRTLRPGGIAAFNSWAYNPNLDPIQVAAKVTRPTETPLPRQGKDKWAETELLQGVVEKGGFEKDKITLVKAHVYVTTSEITRHATMLWSFVGGTSAVGWLKSDEENWDMAVDVLKRELQNTDAYKALSGSRAQLKFVANIAIAMK
jgi:ubiquinone/menaquinone biosynthesis C-methylase UbiE